MQVHITQDLKELKDVKLKGSLHYSIKKVNIKGQFKAISYVSGYTEPFKVTIGEALKHNVQKRFY